MLRLSSDKDPQTITTVVADIPPGSIFVVEGKTFASWLIGWILLIRHILFFCRKGFWTPYSHVGAVVDTNETIEAIPKGVIRGSLSDHISGDRIVTVWKNVNMTSAALAALCCDLESMVGKKYGWLESISYVVPVGEDPEAYNCMEIVVEAFKKIILLPSSMDPHRVTPVDLAAFLSSPRGAGYGWQKIFEYRK